MAIPRTSLLDLPLPVTGSLSGDWGAATNNGLTEYLDIAVAGSLVLNTDADVTLTSTDGDENGTNIGSTTAQYAILRWTATGSTTRNITVPAKSKTYIVINATGGTQSIVLRGAGPTTGVTIVSGEKAVCAWNGSDFVKVGGAAGGTNTQVQYNNNGVFGGVSGATTNGTAITFSTTNLKLQGSSTGVSSFASANSSATDYTVTFPAASTTIPVATQTLTFSGPTAARTITLPDANFTAARTDSAQTFTGVQTFSSNPVLSGGTANGVLYLNGSSVATSGSALTFDGTNFVLGTGGASGSFPFTQRVSASASPVSAFRITNGSDATFDVTLQTSLASFGTGIGDLAFLRQGSEQMRLTSTGLGIGTSSPGTKLQITSGAVRVTAESTTNSSNAGYRWSVKDSGGNVGNSGIYVEPTASISGRYFGFAVDDSTYAMVLNNSGNLGLGVTPSGWGSGIKALQIGTGASLINAGASGDAYLGQNIYYNGTNNIYITTDAASQYALTSGVHKWFTAPSGTAGNAITFTQAMTLDASGNLLVGKTSAFYSSAGRGLIELNGSTESMVALQYGGANPFYVQTNSSASYLWNSANTPLVFSTNNTERARITSGGDLLVGTTTAANNERLNVTKANNVFLSRFINTQASGTDVYGIFIQYPNLSPNSTTAQFLRCDDSTANRFEVRSNGGIANYQANDVNLSDRREKTNFAPAKSYLDTICAIPVQTFEYIDQSPDDPGLTLGVVAQDVQAVAPELVMESNWGTEDNPKMRLSIYQTDLQYALMKCIQEQQALITSLTARVAALEGTQP